MGEFCSGNEELSDSVPDGQSRDQAGSIVWVRSTEVNQIARFCRRPGGIKWPETTLGLYSTERSGEIATDFPIVSEEPTAVVCSPEHRLQRFVS